MDPLDRALL
jgi:hypothetical protein